MSSTLNDPQRSAVLHAGGPLLIFAGAGSGKTRTITYRVAHLIAEHGVPPYRILAVTFTNKAAQEMRERLEKLTGPDIARDLWIGTFHGICVKFLRRHYEAAGLSGSFVIYDDGDQKALMQRAIKALDLDDREYQPKAVLARISVLKREGKDPLSTPLSGGIDETLDTLGREYQALLTRASAIDFDDILLYALRVVEDPTSPSGRELRRKFEHVLVDEFQDTNWVQYRLVRALAAEHRNLCVVGDDDQSIYRWRGADVRIIRGFKKDFPETTVIKLEQNYRSSGNIVSAALGVIALAGDREPKSLWTQEAPGDRVLVKGVSDERAEALFVASAIERARKGGTSSKEQAIFYRTHAQSRVLEEALRSAQIPYQIIGGMKFFERAEIKDLLAYLRLVENPDSDADLLRVINVPTRGIGAKSVAQLLERADRARTSAFEALVTSAADKSLGSSAKKLSVFLELILEFRGARDSLSPSELLERIILSTGYQRALEEEDSAESDARLENIAELLGSLREYESEAPETGEIPSLAGYLERVALVAAVDTLEDAQAVSMMTVHSAKGLEFDQVWITGMEEETFPYRGFGDEDREELDEERRLAYVAITRARRQLTITYAQSRFLFGRTKYLMPSRFLADLPNEAVNRQGQAAHALEFGQETSGFAYRSGYAPGGRNTGFGHERSAGGRSPASAMELKPGERFVERDESIEHGDDGESITVRPGQRVRHGRFGQGIIERVEAGAKPTVVVRFPGYGTRRIVAEFLDFGS